MSLDPKIVEALNEQTAAIHSLVEQVGALEYMLAQTMAVALKSHQDPQKLLTDMQVLFTEKAQSGGVSSGSGNKGFESAERIFSSVKASIN